MSSPQRAVSSHRFFQTGPGQYGEGDEFIGVVVPDQRRVARRFAMLALPEIAELLASPVHEERLTALIILVRQFERAGADGQMDIYSLYLGRAAACVNNWDLVDASAPYIVGPYLRDRPERMSTLERLALSESLWERRISMLATFAYIKQGEAAPALHVADLLLTDRQDLIHKAVGWMLREVGKRCSQAELEGFLAQHYQTMPRAALRYAIERFEPERRHLYLRGTI